MENPIMLKPIRSILLLPVIILFAGLACQLSGGPTPPRPVPTLPDAAQSLNKTIETVQPEATTGKISITVTEAQVTSYVVQNLKDNYAAILSDPVIVFQPGHIELYGTIKGDNIAANGRVIMTVSVDDQGNPVVKATEANFGPIPVPASLLTNLSTAVDQSIANSMKDYPSDYRLESITINTGTATIVLTRK
jgi:hypothetical protein